ncbi:hypothetical protein OL548_23310 [Lysinibacillus sp. MHQ-1]|nr:hypothetical protein OL548_23310 [Lysinibacillus sp. MHQ-1]
MKKTAILLRVALIISSIIMAITSIYYKEMFTIIFFYNNDHWDKFLITFSNQT